WFCFLVSLFVAPSTYETRSSEIKDEIHYYRTDDAAVRSQLIPIVRAFGDQVCNGLTSGFIWEATELRCSGYSCTAKHTTNVAYYDGDVFLTPYLDLLMPTHFRGSGEQ